MRLIGAAFPRTGTMSVRRALAILGFGASYHMQEVFLNPSHADVWNRACDGAPPDWTHFLEDYSATLDGPACLFWREIAGAFPDASVLLLRRDPDAWYESMIETVYPTMMGKMGETDPALRMIRRVFLDGFMEGRFEDRRFATRRFSQYCDEVIREMRPGKLLVYEVTEGWEPLCAFLGCEVPDLPFPARNTRLEFRARAGPDRDDS